jgi:hypothetical protein
LSLQREGKGVMTASDFLRGAAIHAGQDLG